MNQSTPIHIQNEFAKLPIQNQSIKNYKEMIEQLKQKNSQLNRGLYGNN